MSARRASRTFVATPTTRASAFSAACAPAVPAKTWLSPTHKTNAIALGTLFITTLQVLTFAKTPLGQVPRQSKWT